MTSASTLSSCGYVSLLMLVSPVLTQGLPEDIGSVNIWGLKEPLGRGSLYSDEVPPPLSGQNQGSLDKLLHRKIDEKR